MRLKSMGVLSLVDMWFRLEYALQERMMDATNSTFEDADIMLLIIAAHPSSLQKHLVVLVIGFFCWMI